MIYDDKDKQINDIVVYDKNITSEKPKRIFPKLIDKGGELFKSIKKFAVTLPAHDPLNTDLSSKNLLMTLLSKCSDKKELSDFGHYALRLANDNVHKPLIIDKIADSKPFRYQVWFDSYGKAGSGICGLCNVKELICYEGDWEISHIISKKEGGPYIIANLRPTLQNMQSHGGY